MEVLELSCTFPVNYYQTVHEEATIQISMGCLFWNGSVYKYLTELFKNMGNDNFSIHTYAWVDQTCSLLETM